MFEYNKQAWERLFRSEDSEPTEPNQTHYMLGITVGLIVGGIAGYFLNCPIPLATLGAALGMWIGNEFEAR